MKYPDMDSYIRRLTRKRSMTLQDLTRLLGYSSQTSLTRLMQSLANRASLQQFADRLHACSALCLTREESNELDDLIELHDIGSDFTTMVALRRLLRGEAVEYPGEMMLYRADGSSSTFMAHYGSLDIRRILLLNSETAAIFSDLAMLMEQGGFPVEHMLYNVGNSLHMVNCLRAVMPVIYQKGYTCYSHTFDFKPCQPTRGICTSDLLLCEYIQDGQIRSEVTIFTSAVRGEIIPMQATIRDIARCVPRKETMPLFMQNISDMDMIRYNAFCSCLERDSMVCRIKPDPGLEQIPVEILQAAMEERLPDEIRKNAKELHDAFCCRQDNIFEKQTPQYHIYRQGALMRFAETGRLSDHPWCARAFTLRERLDILQYIRNRLMALPGFHLHFLKDDDALRCDEIVLYEGKGLSITKPDTDYDPNHTHAEVLITQPDFLKVFKRFFIESTLRYRVMSEDASAAVMDQIITWCKEKLSDPDENFN